MKLTTTSKSEHPETYPNLAKAFELFSRLPADFFEHGRNDTLPQERDFDFIY